MKATAIDRERHVVGRVRAERRVTQDDMDNGRLICLIGMAPVKPAEFVIFRIGQRTADAAPSNP